MMISFKATYSTGNQSLSLTISFRIAIKYVDQVKMKLDETTNNDANSHNRSILQKLLRLDKQIARVMALDMLTAGIDSVSIRI